MKYHRNPIGCCGVMLLVALLTAPAGAASPDAVDQSIRRGIEYLYSQQNERGHWDELNPPIPLPNQHGGWTAIAVYGLIAGGEDPQDPRVLKGIGYLLETKIEGIYALGLRANVWSLLAQTDTIRVAANRDARTLIAAADKFGRYGYTVKGGGEHNSPTQYGQLGLWACAQVGVEIPTAYWQGADKGWRECQGKDGSWQYASSPPNRGQGTINLTAAGVASLFISQEFLRREEGVLCKGNISDPVIDAGINWITKNFDTVGVDLYGWYGIERIGVASGYKYFGDIDWYARGAEALVNNQAADGSWSTHGTVPATAWGIIVLSRGRAPVVMNKLQYALSSDDILGSAKPEKKRDAKPTRVLDKPTGKEANWNQRQRDAANLTRWMAKSLERDLNWQIMNLRLATMKDMHDAPIVYMSGDQTLLLSNQDIEKLKNYVEGGGIILGHADCGRLDFARSFRRLGQKMFPESEFRPLPDDHPIISGQMFALSKSSPRVSIEGLSNGARELMLLLASGDPGRTWQLNSVGRDAPYQLGTNIFLYAVDKQDLRFKGQTYLVERNETITAERDLKVARLDHGPGWDPEPGGWRRLADIMHNDFKLDLDVRAVKLGEGKLNSNEFKVAHLTGAHPIQLTDAQRQEIKVYVEGGGTLVIDAAGGDGEFAHAIETELIGMFGQPTLKQLDKLLPIEHPIYTLPNSPITEVSYRTFARKNLIGERIDLPRLRGIEINGRTAVIVSREDLSVGLVGQPVDSIYGYSPSDSTRIMTSILLHASQP